MSANWAPYKPTGLPPAQTGRTPVILPRNPNTPIPPPSSRVGAPEPPTGTTPAPVWPPTGQRTPPATTGTQPPPAGQPNANPTPALPPTFGQAMLPSQLDGASTLPSNNGGWLPNLNTNPQVAAEVSNFNANVAPGIQNQMALSGLGQTSATANALARAQAQMLPQTYQNVAQDTLQQEGISTGAEEAQASELMGMSGQQTNQLNTAIGQALQAGQSEQQIRQTYGDAAYNDFLRQQGLSEEAVYGPFGQTIGSAFGSQVQQAK